MALRGTASVSNTTTNATVTVTVTGIGILANDIVLLLVQSGGSTSNTLTFPTGFAAITGLTNQAEGGATTQGAAYKVASGSEPSTYSVTANHTDFMTIECRVYSGRNTSTPFTATAKTA